MIMKCTEEIKESDFSCLRGSNWLHLWVNRVFIDGHPFTYTIEEALEELCEKRLQLFWGISYMGGTTEELHGTYWWRRL